MRRAIAALAIVPAFFLVACGSDGGQQTPNDTADIDYEGAPEGRDKQMVETFDSNVEVQSVTVDGVKCIIAVRNDQSGVALSCVGATPTTSSTSFTEDDE